MSNQPEALRLADQIEDEVAKGRYSVGGPADCAAPVLRQLHAENEALRAEKLLVERRIAAVEERAMYVLQAKIDALMLEHCPEEMTPEQVEDWGKHQVVARAQEKQ